jgi:hypothetical protein
MGGIGALCVMLAFAAPAVAATATAKPAGGFLTRFLRRTAATWNARRQFKQFLTAHPELEVQYRGNKKGAGVSTAMGIVAEAGSYGMAANPLGGGAAVYVPATAVGLGGTYFVYLGNVIRDMARGATVRFAAANGYKVPATLISTMKQAGERFGEFDAKAIAAAKLAPKGKAAPARAKAAPAKRVVAAKKSTKRIVAAKKSTKRAAVAKKSTKRAAAGTSKSKRRT